MSAVEEILSRIPMADLAAQLGVDEATAERAARQAVPALLGGIQANTDDPGGASSFARAVDKHDGALVDGGVDLRQVDATDGNKIVGHVFGPQRAEVVQTLGGIGGVGGKELIAKLLPILAPIVMSWLAGKLSGNAAGPAAGPAAGGGIGDLLGGLLGSVLSGGAGGGAGAGGGLGDLLGGLLGGGRK
ncbi:DUF937 domain-containing protein [Pseudonocardia lacus]|uniref:DUF937 domain-containing protein n=1 Tax=Pseudonocardia lacus TaxID=2835865 RepID=UPI001BDD2C14|nr:DUF937 domain-containing protein [Pseudonocardia lacus]